MKYQFCRICHGITKIRCMFCEMNITDYRKISESQVDHHVYLRKTWLKLKRFNMLTTGYFHLDEELLSMWGQWKPHTAAESYARDVMRGVPFPEYFRNTPLGQEIENMVEALCRPNIDFVKEDTDD